MMADRWGAPLQAGDRRAVALLDTAVESLVALAGDPAAAAVAAAVDPDLPLARIFRAYLHLYSTTRDGIDAAAALLAELPAPGADRDGARLPERETHHLAAARSWVAGDWDGAVRELEQAVASEPRDLLALKVAQDLHFFLGHRAGLRDVVAGPAHVWPASEPGWGWVQGMLAFGLEEQGRYHQAEAAARRALQVEPRDVWAVHALAHVHEMQGHQREGVAFLTDSAANWQDSFFAVHNWWHQALYHLELGQTAEAVALYDGPVKGGRSTEWLDAVDAAALLWRLALYGVDVTWRADQLATAVQPLVGEPIYLFNDWHAIMAFGLAGLYSRNQVVIDACRTGARGTNRAVADQAGLALLQGFAAVADGRPADAWDLLDGPADRWLPVGGSNAQRDVIELTRIAAAARAGDRRRAEGLVAERATRKPTAAAAAGRLLEANGL